MNKGALLLLVLLSGCEEPEPGKGCERANCLDAGPYDAGRPLPKCLGPDSGLGDPCVCQSDCGNTAFCLSELQTGYPRGICLAQSADGGTVGLPTCDATQRCREGWACDILSTQTQGSCYPLCSADGDCPSSGHCDLYTGLCQDELDGDGFGEVCQTDTECKSRDCNIIASGLGLCRSYCNASRGICPEDAVCTPSSRADAGDDFARCEEP